MIDPVRLSRRAIARFSLARRSGYEAALLGAAFASDDQTIMITRADYDRLRLEYKVCGPGCHLKRLLEWWGIRDDGSCGCNEFAARMDNEWGPDGCEQHMDEIIGHLAEAAVRRGLPFVPVVARALVRSAISNARSEADGKKAAAEAG